MSISAPRLTIRTHLPWPLRLLLLLVALAVAAALVLWAYRVGVRLHSHAPSSSAQEQIAALQERVARLSAERDTLSTTADAAESHLNIERATQTQLASQIKVLESDNAKLKEDLVFFQSLLPTNIGAGGIAIQKMRAERVAPNQLHYQLLVIQGSKGTGEFTGNLQLAVAVDQAGKSAMITFPESTAADSAAYKLSFRYYQRLEGTLTLPQGASIKTIQARVLEKGQVRAQESANL